MKFAKRMITLEEDGKELQDIMSLADAPGMIKFSGGFPSPETYPIEDIQECMKEVIDEDAEAAFSYSPTIGYPELRVEIGKRMKKHFDLDFPIDQILLISGSQQGLDLSGLLFIDPGDVILFETPSYLGALNALKTYEAELVAIPTDEDGLILSELKKAFDKHGEHIKMIYVNPDHQNPTGRSWSIERRKEFIDFISAYDVAVLEDAAYAELTFAEKNPMPLIYYDKKGQVIYLGTFSKTFCPGLRTGWMCADKKIIDALLALKTNVDLSPAGVLQRQMAYYLKKKNLDAHIKDISTLYKHRRDVMLTSIQKYFPPEATYTIPSGGLFFWVALPEEIDTRELLKMAIEKRVAFVPGGAFYPNSEKNNEMRLNFSNMPDEEIDEGIKILGDLIKSLLHPN